MTSFTKKLISAFLTSVAAICVVFALFFTVPVNSGTAFAAGETDNTPVALTEKSDFILSENKITGLSETALGKIEGKQFTITVPDDSEITGIAAKVNGSILGEHVTRLTAVTIGANITEIGQNAFFGCKLLKELDLSGATSLTTVGTGAFDTNGTSNGVKTLTIPEKVTSIGNRAFANHTGLTEINFYAAECGDVAKQKDNPFYKAGYNSGVTVNLGATDKKVTKIPANLFYSDAAYVHGVNTVNFVNVDTTASEGEVKFGDNAFHTSKELATVTFETAVIPEIGKNAFSSTKISSITLPAGVTKIGDAAFSSCEALANVNFMDGITYIGNSAFKGCKQLTNAAFTSGSQLTYIGDEAFASSGLTEIVIPKNVTNLGRSAYFNCASANSIRYYAEKLENVLWVSSPFLGVGSMTSGVTLTLGGESMPVTHLQSFLFQSNTSNPINIVSVHFANVQIATTEVGGPLFGNQVFERLTSLKTITFDPSCNIGKIGASAFLGCTALGAIELPASVKTIEDSAFSGCTSLHDINTKNVTYFGASAFKDCVSLYSINLSGVTNKDNIKNNAFSGCTRLIEAISDLSFSEAEKTAKGLSGVNIVATSGITVEDYFVFSGAEDSKSLISYVGNDKVVNLPAGYYSYMRGRSAEIPILRR